MEHKYQIFGDWRDLRGAIEEFDPEWKDRSEAERHSLWAFAENVLKHYQPLTAHCTTCDKTVPWSVAYRCADCRAVCCEGCIRPHFGPDHRPHS